MIMETNIAFSTIAPEMEEIDDLLEDLEQGNKKGCIPGFQSVHPQFCPGRAVAWRLLHRRGRKIPADRASRHPGRGMDGAQNVQSARRPSVRPGGTRIFTFLGAFDYRDHGLP